MQKCKQQYADVKFSINALILIGWKGGTYTKKLACSLLGLVLGRAKRIGLHHIDE